MVQVQQRVLICLFAAVACAAGAKRFYDDDPIERVPQPMRVERVKPLRLSEFKEFFSNTFSHRGELHAPSAAVPAQSPNTVGEVPDSPWWRNRHLDRRMTLVELARGPAAGNEPVPGGRWKVIAAKHEGETPGFTIEDTLGRRYVLKLDPPSNPEMASAADVIGSKFFYALGYNVPENYLVRFQRDQLQVVPNTTLIDARGRRWPITERRLNEILRASPKDKEGRYRAMASLFVPGELVGPFRYHGTRADDPNDTVPHEHRRELRGLYVFCAWLGHTDITSINTMDSLVDHDGLRYLRHHLIDFNAILGSGGVRAKSARSGHVHDFDAASAIKQLFTFGLYMPAWMRVSYPEMPSVGRIEAGGFDPLKWKPRYPSLAFEHRLPDDDFWAAKQVAAFTDQEIAAMIATGEYSDPEAPAYLTRILVERRDKIGRTFFERVLPLEGFRVENGRLLFRDLAADHGFREARSYTIRWSGFENATGGKKTVSSGDPTGVASSAYIPEGLLVQEYFAADITAAGSKQPAVTVFLRRKGGDAQVVGVDRTW